MKPSKPISDRGAAWAAAPAPSPENDASTPPTPPPKPATRLQALRAALPARLTAPRIDSHRWAGPFGLPSRSRNGIASPHLRRETKPVADPETRPATGAQRAAMDSKLRSAVSAVSGVNRSALTRRQPGGQQPAPPDLSGTALHQDFMAMGLNEAQARQAAAHAGSALLASVGDVGGQDVLMWQHLSQNDPGRLGEDAKRAVNATLRTFASNGPAFDALWHMKTHRRHADAAQPGNAVALRQALQAVDQLIALGVVAPHEDHAWQSVAARADARRDELLATRLGSGEGPDALAWMTLLHAAHQLCGTAGPAPACLRAASMAWRNGYTTSGKGTTFNRAVHRLHKFSSWVNRAQRSGQGRHFLQRAFGKQLSPLLAMKHGLLGGDLGDFATETRRLHGHTQGAVQALGRALQQAIDASAYAGLDPESKALLHLRKAVIDHWADCGETLHAGMRLSRADRDALVDRAAQNPSAPKLRGTVAMKTVRTRFSLEVLERWAESPLVATAAAQPDSAQHASNALRATNPDSAPKSNTRDSATLLEISQKALNTEGLQFRHGGVVGLEPTVNIGLATGSAALAGAGGSLRASRGRSATVRIGTSTIGSDIFIGTEARRDGAASVFAYGGPPLPEQVKLGFSGRLAYRRDAGRETGVSLRVSKNIPDHKQQIGSVIDFLFKAAAEEAQAPSDAAAFWEKFAVEFFDSDVSCNFVEANQVNHRLIGTLGCGGGIIFNRQSAGPLVRAGFERSWLRARRTEPAGLVTSETALRRTAGTASAQLTLGWNPIPSVSVEGTTRADTVGTTHLPAAIYSADFSTPFGSTGQIRMTVENDRVEAALSLQQREFPDREVFIGHLQQRRELWRAALGGAQNFDAAIADIRALGSHAGKAAGNCCYTERLQLTLDAAERLTLLLSQRSMASRGTAHRGLSIDQLNDAIESVLGDQDSWIPEKLAVFEVAGARDEAGPDFGIIAKTVVQAKSVTRYLYQAKAQKPASHADIAGAAALPGEAGVGATPGRPQTPKAEFREAVAGLFPNVGDRYVGTLCRALLRALPPAEGAAPYAAALLVAEALRATGTTRALDAVSVLANVIVHRPQTRARIIEAGLALEARLGRSTAGRTALSRLHDAA